MPPTAAICLRCQSKLLWRHLQWKKREAHNLASFSSEDGAADFQSKQEDIIPPKQTKTQLSNVSVWPTHQTVKRRAGHVEDPLLKYIFDSNRHKLPTTATHRYSGRPIEQPMQTVNTHGINRPEAASTVKKYASVRIILKNPLDTSKPYRDKSIHDGQHEAETSFASSKSDILIKRLILHSHSEKPKLQQSAMKRGQIIGAETREPETTKLARNDKLRDPIANLKSKKPRFPVRDLTDELDHAGSEGKDVQMTDIHKAATTTVWKPDPRTLDFRKGVWARDTVKTNKLWQQFREHVSKGNVERLKLDRLFADFLWGFSDLRKTQPLQEVWSFMIQQGIKPNVHHWNAVLDVLQKTRDLERFNATWELMLDSGTQPDNQSWTSRIILLLGQPYKNWHDVMRLLDDMGQQWRAAQAEAKVRTSTDKHDAQKLPSIVPINAAIAGLLRLHRVDVAKDVLKWAQSFSIEIDTACYNIFLRHACQRGDVTGAESLVQEMETNGVKQDIVTKTIVLDNMLRNPDSPLYTLSPVEQEQVVVDNLNRMSDDGEPPNAQTYAVALYALLHQPKPNLPAARAIYRLLDRQHKTVPPHIYTILFMYHFKSKTPDLDALESLWKSVEKKGSRVDHVLYDRMIEGYASIGELDRMLAFFKKMTDAGQVPGWLALERALTALIKKRAWDRCAQLVSDVTSENGHLHVGKRGWRGEKEFWQLVSDLREQKLIPYEK